MRTENEVKAKLLVYDSMYNESHRLADWQHEGRKVLQWVLSESQEPAPVRVEQEAKNENDKE